MERAELQKRWSNVIFAILFLVSLLLFGRIMAPFVMPVLLGGFLVVLFEPVQAFLCRATRGRTGLAAALSTIAVLLLIVVPIVTIAFLVGREIMSVADAGRHLLDDVNLRAELADKLPRSLRHYLLPETRPQTQAQSQDVVAAAVTGSAALLKDVVGAGTDLAISVFLMAVAMYYFFLDGRRIFGEVTKLIPMDRRYLDAFAKEFRDVAYAIVYGNTLTAVIQGSAGLIGLWIAKVPHPLVWAVAMMVVALIPVGGTALVWLPISIVLMVTHHIPQGLFLLAWGALVVSTIDNLVRPRLCGSRMTLHPLLVFLSMFGGLAVFGMMGLLVGPLIASIFMAMVRIYRRDFLGIASATFDKLARSGA